MNYSKIPLAQTVAELCKAYHIQHIVISPGSRNAPLTISFTNDSFFKCYSIVDERCAGFFALGIAQQLQQPVALVCTSGSALLNYFPAVSEAYYSHIPLLVLSADRPKYLIDIGDGQTIKQNNVYGTHVHYNANLKLDIRNHANIAEENQPQIIRSLKDKTERFLNISKDIQVYNEQEINTAVSRAITQSGPVHVNCPFDEPLYEVTNRLEVEVHKIEYDVKTERIDKTDMSDAINDWQKAHRKMILVGVNSPDSIEQKWLELLSQDDSVIVFTETTSNLYHEGFFPSIDKIIAPLEDTDFEKLQPEILLTFGGLVVSKKIKAFLRKYQPQQHWHVGKERANDTFFCLSKHFKTTPNDFFEMFLSKVKPLQSEYKPYWSTVKAQRSSKHEAYLEHIPFSDFEVFDVVLKAIPDHSQLQVGNSSAIRYTQLFDINPTLQVFCNRGTSGIDGSTSTAIGAAVISDRQTTFITGDLSFFYDSNAFWNTHIPSNFRVIVINNGGGGIFRILPGHKDTENFDTYFETKHGLKAKSICDMYNLEYTTAKDKQSLSAALDSFYKESDRPKLLEIFTSSHINDKILLDYFKYIK